MSRREPIVERRSLKQGSHAVSMDDAAKFRAVIKKMRHMTNEVTHPLDMINFVHKCAGELEGIEKRLEPVEVRDRVLRSWQAPAKLARPPEPRTIVSAKGKRVRVEARPSRQLEMAL